MSAARGNFTKGRFYKAGRIVPGVDNVVSALNEDKHKAMRAQMNSTVWYLTGQRLRIIAKPALPDCGEE